MTDNPTSNVLVLEEDAPHEPDLNRFLEARHLSVVRFARERLGPMLRSNVELGAILLCERYAQSVEDTARIAAKIHSLRPEVPIILRREGSSGELPLPDELRRVCCAVYDRGDVEKLGAIVDEFIFTLIYPNSLVRGIADITTAALNSQFQPMNATLSTPYIVRDRMIFGEVLTLIPLESAWCRGYMMLQMEEAPLLEYLAVSRPDCSPSFRMVNNLLSETTNMIWGAFKNRYIGDDSAPKSAHVQVPLVVNHHHRYISFGTDKPQLCFTYTLQGPSIRQVARLYQRFVFNLNWSPEDFREVERDETLHVDAGELEMF